MQAREGTSSSFVTNELVVGESQMGKDVTENERKKLV
jgi:hypothetical protein